MKFQGFKFIFLVAAFAIPSKHSALGGKNSPKAATSNTLSQCPKSQCLTDAISCLAAKAANDGNSGGRLTKLEKEVANLKAKLAKAGKPLGFALLDSNGRLPQNLLLAGYDKYSAYDLAWQSLHMAAAAACRGSTSSGGTGCCGNMVMARNARNKKTCAQICAQTSYRNCDGELSVYGTKGKATHDGQTVGFFYNYGCNHGTHGGSEASVSDQTVLNSGGYFSFCCCRK